MNPHQKPQEDVVGLTVEAAVTAIAEYCRKRRVAGVEPLWSHMPDVLMAAADTSTYEAGRRDMREAAGKVAADVVANLAAEMPMGSRSETIARNIMFAILALPTEPLGGEG